MHALRSGAGENARKARAQFAPARSQESKIPSWLAHTGIPAFRYLALSRRCLATAARNLSPCLDLLLRPATPGSHFIESWRQIVMPPRLLES